MRRIRKAVVVLPFVPVTPATRRLAVGSPQKRTASGAIAARASPTITWVTGRSSRRSTTRVAAPLSTAAAAKSCPSLRAPGTQKKSAPGATWRLSYARPAISTSPSPATSATSVPASSSRGFIGGDCMAVRASGTLGGAAGGGGRRASLLVGRDLEVGKREPRDLAERRRCDLAAVILALRSIDDHGDQQPRILGGGKAYERGDILRLRVVAVDRDLRRPGLAGQRVARDADLRSRAPRRQDAHGHIAKLRRRVAADHPVAR